MKVISKTKLDFKSLNSMYSNSIGLTSWSLLKTLVLIFLIAFTVEGQIPNAGFESWTNGNPDGWITDNDPGDSFVPITPTSDSHSGNNALIGEVKTLQGFPLNPVLSSVFPYSERPANFTGYYKFTSVGSDSLVILVSFGSSKDSAGRGGGGSMVVKNTVNDYTEFNIPIYWASQNNPDSCIISFTVFPYSPAAHAGTFFIIDDLSFTNNTTSVKNNLSQLPQSFNLSQNYPNPFNPTTTIDYQIPKQSHVRLSVYDILGNKVEDLVNENKSAGKYYINFNASSLSSGTYFYQLEAGNYMQTKKLILIK